MNMAKLAELLYVDEVSLMHGPKGVAVHVRIEKSWHSTTIDNEDLGHGAKRVEKIAEHLVHLADANMVKVRGGEDFRKSAATRAALEADAAAARNRSGRMLSWEDVGGYQPWDTAGRQQQVQRAEPAPAAYSAPTPKPSEPASSAPMASRFHAIVAELSKP